MKELCILLLSLQLIAANNQLNDVFQIVQKCYESGKNSAALQTSCLYLPNSININHDHSKSCFSSYVTACLHSYENATCEYGIEAAKGSLSCDDNKNDIFKKCCNACQLGVEIQSSVGSCTQVENLLKLDAQTMQIVNNCCHFELKRLIEYKQELEKINKVNPDADLHLFEFQKIEQTTMPFLTAEKKNLKEREEKEPTTQRLHKINSKYSGMCSKYISLCEEDEICSDTEDYFICKCKFGFIRNTTTNNCEDINECSENIHKCESFEICINEPGSYACEAVMCPQGYKIQSYSVVDRDIECLDVNECLNEPCDKNELCINTEGGFECTQIDVLSQHCADGFEMIDEDCVDKNECRNNACSKNEICTNLKGSFRCEKIECGKHYSIFLKSNCRKKQCKTHDLKCHKLPTYIKHFFKIVDLTDTNRSIIRMEPTESQRNNDLLLNKFDNNHFEVVKKINFTEIRMIKLPKNDLELKIEVKIHDKFGNNEIKQLNVYHIYVELNENV